MTTTHHEISSRNRPAVILLVEDDPGDQELIRRALVDCAVRHELHVVVDGAMALDYLCARACYAAPGSCPPPDLILLDFNLPKLNGIQVLEQIKQHPGLRRIPVIFLSTSRQEREIRQSYDGGANSYIVKPVLFEDYLRIIRRIDEYWLQTVHLSDPEEPPCPPST